MPEEWKIIKEYPDYKISSLGRIMSFKYKEPRILKHRANRRGYLYVNLCCGDGKYTTILIHRLVAIYFLGNSDLTVNHKNGNKLNNTVDNLEWVTMKENWEHASKNKLLAYGEKNGGSKLNLLKVKQIRYKYSRGTSQAELSRQFKVSEFTISKILTNQYWK